MMAKQDPIMEKAVEMLRIASLDPEARMQYEMREKALKDIASIRGDGVREGIREGMREGKQEVAKKMLKKGMDVEDIADLTGLSSSEVMVLKNEMNS